MDLQKEYLHRLMQPEKAVDMVKDNQTIVAAMAASEPPALLKNLARKARELKGVRICTCLLMRDYGFMDPSLRGHILNESWFFGPWERKYYPEKMATHLPNNLHEAGQKKSEKDQIDFFWGTAAPMDENGFFSLSLGVTYEKIMVEKARFVVLEVNESLPRTMGDTQVHISQIDGIVENNEELVELPPTDPTEADLAIGDHIAELVEDGSTIQLGIGGIPNAIARNLKNKKDLGIHTEMFTDGMVDLFEAGAITGQKKTLWPGKMVGTFALGTNRLYRFIDLNPGIEFQQGNITNDPYVIGKNYKMVSINTALQVDLSGQVVSEWLGGRQFSGTGGQADTHRGAQRSPGGKGIIALRSTAKKGTISTIQPQLPAGAQVTLGRQEIDLVVTEYGVASLKGMSVRERVRRLIAIAHPDFRNDLKKEAERLEIW